VFPGFGIDHATPPEPVIDDCFPVERVALLGADYPGLRPKLTVEQGDRVSRGQPLFHDRAHPDVVFVAPVSGVVESITLGPRRRLSALVIRAESDLSELEPVTVAGSTGAELRATLLAHGLWSGFLTRPFGRMPAPDATPDAIFVTATADNPHAPGPNLVIEGREVTFRAGVKALTLLTGGTVHVCQNPGSDIAVGLSERVRSSVFPAGSSSGRAGAHIHRLHPVGAGRSVWSIGYQDVMAIGVLLETGIQDFSRIVSLTGSRAKRPHLVRTVIGASLQDLIREETLPGDDSAALAILSGSAMTGRLASWLGRYHQQVTLMSDLSPRQAAPGHGLFARLFGAPSQVGPLVPTAALERALGFDIPAVPFLRALSVGDAETARRLGCLGLVEEDIAAASLACTSGADYGRMLRHVLDELAEDA